MANTFSISNRLAVAIILLAVTAMTGNASEKVDYGLITGSVDKPTDASLHAAYCDNIRDAAAEARDAIRVQYLSDLEAQIEKRMVALEEKRVKIEKWMKRRQEFIDRAQSNLIDIYSAMRPESAAEQISILDDETAAAILLELKPRTASAILNEIKPTKAARLAGVIVGSTKVRKKKDKS